MHRQLAVVFRRCLCSRATLHGYMLSVVYFCFLHPPAFFNIVYLVMIHAFRILFSLLFIFQLYHPFVSSFSSIAELSVLCCPCIFFAIVVDSLFRYYTWQWTLSPSSSLHSHPSLFFCFRRCINTHAFFHWSPFVTFSPFNSRVTLFSATLFSNGSFDLLSLFPKLFFIQSCHATICKKSKKTFQMHARFPRFFYCYFIFLCQRLVALFLWSFCNVPRGKSVFWHSDIDCRRSAGFSSLLNSACIVSVSVFLTG